MCALYPCTGDNTQCTSNADGTRTCTCTPGYAVISGIENNINCECKFALFVIFYKFSSYA